MLDPLVRAELTEILKFLVAATTFGFWALKLATGIVLAWRSRAVSPGIYRGRWLEPRKREVNVEVLRIRRSLFGFRASPVYAHKARHAYTLHAIPLWLNRDIFRAYWRKKRRDIHEGRCPGGCPSRC